jgi:hypothetical protein
MVSLLGNVRSGNVRVNQVMVIHRPTHMSIAGWTDGINIFLARLDLEGADPEVSFHFSPSPPNALDVAVIHYRRDTESPAMTVATRERLQELITRSTEAWRLVSYLEGKGGELDKVTDDAGKLSDEMWELFRSLPWDETRVPL